MRVKTISFKAMLTAAIVAAVVAAGCSTSDVRKDTVASANGDEIRVHELREFLGAGGGLTAVPHVPIEKKKEALDRLIAGRLLAQEARTKGLDNTEEYRAQSGRAEQSVWITALFRKEMETRLKLDDKEIKGEAKKLMEADPKLPEGEASARAGRAVFENRLREIESGLVAEARKDRTASVDRDALQKIAKGDKVPDDAVLAVSGTSKISYGEAKRLLQGLAGSAHGGAEGQDLSRNPAALERVLDREMTGRALYDHAKKQGVEGSEWLKTVRQDMERSILIDLIAEREILKSVAVTEKEVENAYKEHAQMFVREGKKIPYAEVKEQIRGFIRNDKRRKAIDAYVDTLKKKAKITVNESLLSKV